MNGEGHDPGPLRVERKAHDPVIEWVPDGDFESGELAVARELDDLRDLKVKAARARKVKRVPFRVDGQAVVVNEVLIDGGGVWEAEEGLSVQRDIHDGCGVPLQVPQAIGFLIPGHACRENEEMSTRPRGLDLEPPKDVARKVNHAHGELELGVGGRSRNPAQAVNLGSSTRIARRHGRDLLRRRKRRRNIPLESEARIK